MEQILTHLQLFPELEQGCFFDVRIAKVLAVASGIVVHGFLQCLGNADIVHDQSARLAVEHPVHACDGLHQVVSAHRFVHIHRGQRRHIEPRQPHVHHNGNLHRVIVVLEAFGQLFFVLLVTYDGVPFFRIFVAGRHHHFHLFPPLGAQFQQLVIDAHGYRARIGHNHGLARQFILPVLFVMFHDVAAQGIDGGRRTQNFFQVRHFLFAFFDLLFGSPFFSQQVVFVVDGLQRSLVQIQIDHTRFVIDRASSPVGHCLGHVVHVDVVAKHFDRIPVFRRDGRSCKANVRGVGQAVMDDSCRSHHAFGHFFTLLVSGHAYLLFETILPPMGFVGHHHDILSERQWLGRLLELLHGGEDDAVGLASCQQCFQVVAALCLNRHLPQEILTLGKLCVQLVVEVVAVGNHHDGGLRKLVLQQMGIKHHRKRFSAALRVPEDANLAVILYCCFRPLDGLLHSKILMVGRQYLGCPRFVFREADKVADDVQQPSPLEDAFKERIIVGKVRTFIIAVPGFPFHVAVFLAGNGSGLRASHVAHHAENVVHKQRRNLLHVVAQLPIGFRSVGLFARGRLQLHHHQRQAVDKHNQVRPLFRMLDERPLVDNLKIIAFRVCVVYQIHQVVALLPAVEVRHLDTMLQVVHKAFVLLRQASCIDVLQLAHSLLQGRLWFTSVQVGKAQQELLFIERHVIVALYVGAIQMSVAYLFEEGYHRFFIIVFYERHGIILIGC
ncbi:putative uncharacterized protein [Bacteroides sp. CAG:661]|nr:putative uncharacterized protein [Bacteroides sp. CAG:661]